MTQICAVFTPERLLRMPNTYFSLLPPDIIIHCIAPLLKCVPPGYSAVEFDTVKICDDTIHREILAIDHIGHFIVCDVYDDANTTPFIAVAGSPCTLTCDVAASGGEFIYHPDDSSLGLRVNSPTYSGYVAYDLSGKSYQWPGTVIGNTEFRLSRKGGIPIIFATMCVIYPKDTRHLKFKLPGTIYIEGHVDAFRQFCITCTPNTDIAKLFIFNNLLRKVEIRFQIQQNNVWWLSSKYTSVAVCGEYVIIYAKERVVELDNRFPIVIYTRNGRLLCEFNDQLYPDETYRNRKLLIYPAEHKQFAIVKHVRNKDDGTEYYVATRYMILYGNASGYIRLMHDNPFKTHLLGQCCDPMFCQTHKSSPSHSSLTIPLTFCCVSNIRVNRRNVHFMCFDTP